MAIALSSQRERLFEPCRDFVEELLRAFVDGFRRAGAFLGVGFFTAAFLIALRGAVAEADFFPGLVFPRLDAEAAFVFEPRFFPPRAFFVLPVRVSTKAVTALEATFITKGDLRCQTVQLMNRRGRHGLRRCRRPGCLIERGWDGS